jgi:cytochrome d oxidase subunit CydB
MNNPAGAHFNYHTMRMELTHLSDLLFNPVAQVKFVHTVSAGYVTASMFVLGISALYLRRPRKSRFVSSSLSVAGVILTAGASMFPFVMPSSAKPDDSLTLLNATSSQLTLQIMLIAVAVFLPIVLLYTTWAYRVMFGRVRAEDIERDASLY